VAEKNPVLTNAARPATFEVEAYNERGEMVPTAIAGEHPLTLYLDKREIVTLMTLGHAPEALAIGYLRNQRLVSSLEELTAVQVDWETESVAVTTHSKKAPRNLGKKTVTSGCGQGTMFGDLMEEIDSVKLREDVRLADADLAALSQLMHKSRLQIDDVHIASSVVQNRVIGDPLSAAEPLLAGGPVSILDAHALGQHLLVPRRPLADHNFAVVSFRCLRSIEQHPAAVGAFRRRVEVSVDRMLLGVRDRPDLDARFPMAQRAVVGG